MSVAKHLSILVLFSVVTAVASEAPVRKLGKYAVEKMQIDIGGVEETFTLSFSELETPSGDVLLLHKSGAASRPGADNILYLSNEGFLTKYPHPSYRKFSGSFADIAKQTGLEIVHSQKSDWHTVGKKEVGDPRFNSHAFTLGDSFGLTPGDWLSGNENAAAAPSQIQERLSKQNPMDLMLRSYFKPIRVYQIHPKQRFSYDEARSPLREGDIVVLTIGKEFSPKGTVQHSFSARITEVTDKDAAVTKGADKTLYEVLSAVTVEGKVGESFPIMRGPLIKFAEIYHMSFNEIRFYRQK